MQTIHNTWTDKVDYTLSTPTKGVIFGTLVEANFKIASLLKGLMIGEVTTLVIETHDVWIDPKFPERKKSTWTRRIAEDRYEIPQDEETRFVDGYDTLIFSRRLTLPKTLRKCLQTVDTKGIRIKHDLRFNIKLMNPEGHISQLTAILPLHIYISPLLLVDEDNNISPGYLHGVDPGVDPRGYAVEAPPQYGEHQSDVLYSGLNPSGYTTPAGGFSGVSTPFNSQSRRGSADNLASLHNINFTSITPIALQSRLNNLGNAADANEDMSAIWPQRLPESTSSGPFDASESEQADLSASGPQHLEVSQEEMCRVPSYSTALRSQPHTSIGEVPPTYQTIRTNTRLSTQEPAPRARDIPYNGRAST